MDTITRFISGEEAALEEIITKYSNPLMRYCYGILYNYYDAEDAVQLTFIKAYEKRNDIRDKEIFSAYLFAIAYRTSIDIIRKRRFKLIPSVDETKMQETEELVSNFPEDIKEALLKLKPKDRALFYSRAVEERSYRELSEIYGRSEPSLRKQYERIRNKLTKILNNQEEGLDVIKEES